MSIATIETANFNATLGEKYQCIGNITGTMPAITSSDAGGITFINAGTNSVTISPSGTDTVGGKSSYVLAPKRIVYFVSDQNSNWVAMIFRPNPTITIPLIKGLASTSSTTYSEVTAGGIYIGSPADYGFEWATVMTARIDYVVKVAGTSPTGKIKIVEDTAENGTGNDVAGSEITGITDSSATLHSLSAITITANKSYYPSIATNSAINSMTVYKANLVITFS